MRCFCRLLVALLLPTLLSVAASAQENDGKLNYQYCTKGDYSNRCANPADTATCQPLIDVAKAECEVFMLTNTAKFQKYYMEAGQTVYKYLLEISLMVVTLISAGFAGYFRKKFEALKKRLLDPLIRRAPKFETLGVNALVVGKSGTGKTSIIRALSGSKQADPSVSTAINNVYSLAHEINNRSNDVVVRRLLRFFISDHVGQDFGSIPQTAFFQELKLSKLPKCMIFVVDLFPADENYQEDNRYEKPNSPWIDEQMAVFSADMIRNLTYDLGVGSTIVLFINKVDKLNSITPGTSKHVLSYFNELINRLRNVRGSKFVAIVGSAKNGWGISGCDDNGNGAVAPNLYQTLLDTAQPVKD